MLTRQRLSPTRHLAHRAGAGWLKFIVHDARDSPCDDLRHGQRHLYCKFDMSALTEDSLCEPEALAIEHGDCILPGHLLQEATVAWD
jgi:hypothetical protein